MKKTIKTGVFITDTHWVAAEEMHPAYRLVKRFIRAFKPDVLIHGGDLSDWEFLAKFNKEKLRLLADKTYRKEYDLIQRELDFYQKYCKGVHILLGNHDMRVYDAIDCFPSLEGLVEFENQLDLGDIKIYSQLEQPIKFGKLGVLHGWYHTKHHTDKHLEEYSGNLLYGHMHKHQLSAKILYGQGGLEIEAQSIACLCDKQPDWYKGRPSHWQHQFAVIYWFANGDFQVFPINIIRNRFVAPDGRAWSLE